MSELVLAVSRGRLLTPTLDLLRLVGIVSEHDFQDGRELMSATNHDGLSLVVVRASDIPACVAHGGADMGVTGSDVLLEKPYGDVICDPAGLGIGACKLVVAAPSAAVLQQRLLHKLRIATKFANTSRDYFARQHGCQVQIIELGGSVEIAPALGMADAIVDLADTGRTLKANNLQIVEKIADISARVIVNRAAYKMKYDAIKPLLQQLIAVKPHGSRRLQSALLSTAGKV